MRLLLTSAKSHILFYVAMARRRRLASRSLVSRRARRATYSRLRKKLIARRWRRKLKGRSGLRKRMLRKLKLKGFYKHRVKGTCALSFANRVTNNDNTAPIEQTDRDYATFNIQPWPVDMWSHHTKLSLGSFYGNSGQNYLNTPNIGSLNILPSHISSLQLWEMDNQISYLASCFGKFKIKTASIEFMIPEVQQDGNAGIASVYNNSYVLMYRHTDDILPMPLQEMLAYVRGFNSSTPDQPQTVDSLSNMRALQPIANAPSPLEVEYMTSEKRRNIISSGWKRLVLKPGRKYRIKWHPRTYSPPRPTGEFEVWNNGDQRELPSFLHGVAANSYQKPRQPWISSNVILSGSSQANRQTNSWTDVLWMGPVFILLDMSHSSTAKYLDPANLAIKNVVQSQFNIKIDYYLKILWNDVRVFFVC